MKKKDYSLLVTALIGVALLIALLFTLKKEDQQSYKPATTEEVDSVSFKARRGVHVDGYKKTPLKSRPVIPSITRSEDGITQVIGNDSVEVCTDIPGGKQYAIIIETGRRTPLWGLFNEAGDSLEWEYSTQVLRLDEATYHAKLLEYHPNDEPSEIPFWVEEFTDSIPENHYCTITLAEIDETADGSERIDSICSGVTRFPAFASGTAMVQRAGEKSSRVYIKVSQPGIISLTISSADDACGYALLGE